MSDHYPTDDDLKRLREWDFNDMRGWFDFAQSVGNYWPEDSYWTEEPAGVFHISTGGWSGNEDIIAAMSENFICWTQTWIAHRRGGHYEFQLPGVVRAAPREPSPEAVKAAWQFANRELEEALPGAMENLLRAAYAVDGVGGT